ncbi:hypothetical protein [Mycobacterium sp. 852002-30065_SCH5024008]|uniref:hypothetical protein n=1 Tax=Mycobacterium sp. 852002-30065_SCH5024008 TaxID=1834088 RepID=UPI0007FF9A40|nr:hypothetical protein [Mycobacterium sp. 852002-30065_SCH5024008]OBB89647.1 hypothetical protein A5781_00065 [Mycobacterium sp. 852002-30065_SCH5024008]
MSGATLICYRLRGPVGGRNHLAPAAEFTEWDSVAEALDAARIVPCDEDGACRGDHVVVYVELDFRQRERWRVRRARTPTPPTPRRNR